MFSDKIMFGLFVHPTAQSYQHHDRRLMHKPRHRYEQPIMFPMNMDANYYRRHGHSMLIPKNKINMTFFF